MWCKAKAVAGVVRFKAFSLLETLIVLSLGSVIIWAGANLYRDLILAQQRESEQFRLQRSAQQLLDYIKHYVLHSGYQGVARENSNFALFMPQGKPYRVEPHCLIVLADMNHDGCLGSRSSKHCLLEGHSVAKEIKKEVLAFKLEQKQLFVLSKNEQFSPCSRDGCARLLQGCDQLKWEKIANQPDSRIEDLQFRWLKVGKLLSVHLVLSASSAPAIRYESEAQIYLLNGDSQ